MSSLNLNKMCRNIYIIFIIILNVITKINTQCSWDFIEQTHLKCQLRITDFSGLKLQEEMSAVETSDKLTIECINNDILQQTNYLKFENAFNRLHKLTQLNIASCNLQKLNSYIFEGLYSLKLLKIQNDYIQPQQGLNNNINFNNNNLEIYANAFKNLNELQILDLSENSLKKLPDGIWCSLKNLKELNLTRNRFINLENIGFSDNLCPGQSDIELKQLDLSLNEIQSLPDNWGISRLRHLQILKLQNNNITHFSSNSLSGLTSLRILNLSTNYLETLPADSFAGNKELREIHLKNNQLYDLPKGLFNRLEQLLVLDLSGNQLTSHHVDNATFSGLIRLVILNLYNNALTRIGSKTFKDLYFLQILDLRNNSIGHIEDGAFLPLYNLHTLNLAENRLHTLDNRIFNGLFVLSKLTLNNNLINTVESKAFRNCSDLKELDLSSNQLSDVPEAIQDLKILKTLDLGENQIAELSNGTFKNLDQLTGLRLIENRIGNITRGMFWDLPRLSVLNLAKNRIQHIEEGAFERNIELEAIRLDKNYLTDINGMFATLASLLWLNLSENHMVWFDYAFIPKNLKWLDIHGNFIEALGNYYKLQEEIMVKTVDASHNRITEIGPMSVPNSIELLFINNNLIRTIHPNTFVDKTHLARVDLYSNLLAKLQLNSIRVAPVPNMVLVPEFYLGGNPFECDCTMEWLQRINNLTTRQHPKIMDLHNIECLIPRSRTAPLRPLASLETKDFLCKYERHCPALCKCCDFDACDCEMQCPDQCSCFHDATWSTNIVDCGKRNSVFALPGKIPMDVSNLYLDGNNLPILQNQIFIGRKKLTELYLNSSNIISIENQTFSGLNMLQILHLENNILQTLHGNEFEHLTLLKELYLHNNLLTHIGNNTFSSLVSLKTLRIDNNRLISMPVMQLHTIKSNNNFESISMGRNPWTCQCKYFNDLSQFVSENALAIQDIPEIYCIDGSNKHDLDINAIHVDCIDYLDGNASSSNQKTDGYIPLLGAVLLLIFLIVILIVVFIFRESVRVWLFAHYGVRVCESRFEETGKLYDAIILHSTKDYQFVCQNIAGELEHGRPPFRLCIQQRDLPPEASHLQIVEASRASRKIILILTRHFIQTEWVRSEFRNAFHEALRGLANKLVIIEESEVCGLAEDVAELSPYLKSMPSNRIITNDTYFWEKLRYAIPIDFSSRGNNYTIDHHERFKQPVSPGVIFRQAPPPPAYFPEELEANYSSATTATPSPRPTRHGRVIHHNVSGDNIPLRPPSEHIYSSIESEYNSYDNHENLSMIPSGKCIGQQQMYMHQPRVHNLRSNNNIQQQQQRQINNPSIWRAINIQAEEQQQQQQQQQQSNTPLRIIKPQQQHDNIKNVSSNNTITSAQISSQQHKRVPSPSTSNINGSNITNIDTNVSNNETNSGGDAYLV